MIDMKLLKKQIDDHSVISFDVYDTLLLRPFVKPSDIFDYIEDKYGIRGFSKARNHVKVTDKREKTIEDIYKNIQYEFKNCIDLELKEEKELTYPNPVIKKIFDYAKENKKTIVILSDIYFQNSFIKELLYDNGYKGYSKLFCSCDYQKTKCSGELFKQLLDEYDVIPEEILHIGDNDVSDYAVPKTMGIDTFKIKQNYECYLKYRGYLYGNIYNYWDSFINKLCADNYAEDIKHELNPIQKCWYRFGYDVAGPICWTFSKWINEIVEGSNGNFTDVAFVARDGYLIKKMFDQLKHDKSVKSHYIYAPRILATLVQESYAHGGDVQKLISKEKDIINQIYGLNEADEKQRLAFIQKVIEKYKLYLKNECFDGGTIGVVDSSTNNLSSQKLVDHFTDNETCGLYWFVSQYACSMDYNLLTCQKEHYAVIGSVDLFELIFKSPEPTIKSFSLDGKILFNEINKEEQNRICNFSFIEEGAMDFFKNAESKKIVHFPNADTINRYLKRYCENPVANERKIIEAGLVSGGIANSEWTPTEVFIDRKKYISHKFVMTRIKNKITRYPKLFMFLRSSYHLIVRRK